MNNFYIIQNRRTNAIVFVDCNNIDGISKLCSNNYRIVGSGTSKIDAGTIMSSSGKHYHELYIAEVEKNKNLICVLNNAVKIIGS